MRAASVCFSMLKIPRLRMVALDNICLGSFSGLWMLKNVRTLECIGSRISSVGGHGRQWSIHPVATKIEDEGSKFSSISNTSEIKGQGRDVQEDHYSDIRVRIAENEDLAKLVTFIVMDIETTGFSKEVERIIEVAVQDLKGGQNSTFQTLVNPQRPITNSHIHGITNSMTDGPSVPRMEDLIPVLIQYIRSRQQPGGLVVLIAHNGRTFDFPFLIKEFNRYSYEIPSDWWFLDTLPLAREARGSRESASLASLKEHYKVSVAGSAHRAMSDVYSLASIFQKITFDLKLPASALLHKCFKASDLGRSDKEEKEHWLAIFPQ